MAPKTTIDSAFLPPACCPRAPRTLAPTLLAPIHLLKTFDDYAYNVQNTLLAPALSRLLLIFFLIFIIRVDGAPRYILEGFPSSEGAT